MSALDNRRIVLGLFQSMNAGNGAAIMGALADSATWWVAGNLPFSGTKTKAELGEMMDLLGSKINGPLRITPTGVTAEGDRVAVEAESFGKMKNGKIYQINSHFLFLVRDGKIQRVKQYFDSTYANELLRS
jgi:uncharacterized protein